MRNDPTTDERVYAGLSKQYYSPERINDEWYVMEMFFGESKTTYLVLANIYNNDKLFMICPCVDSIRLHVQTDGIVCSEYGYTVMEQFNIGGITFELFNHNTDLWCHYTYNGEDFHVESRNTEREELFELLTILFEEHSKQNKVVAENAENYAEAVNLDVLSEISINCLQLIWRLKKFYLIRKLPWNPKYCPKKQKNNILQVV